MKLLLKCNIYRGGWKQIYLKNCNTRIYTFVYVEKTVKKAASYPCQCPDTGIIQSTTWLPKFNYCLSFQFVHSEHFKAGRYAGYRNGGVLFSLIPPAPSSRLKEMYEYKIQKHVSICRALFVPSIHIVGYNFRDLCGLCMFVYSWSNGDKIYFEKLKKKKISIFTFLLFQLCRYTLSVYYKK